MQAQDCLQVLREFFASRSEILNWGIAPAQKTPKADLLKSWVDQGHHGSLEYMASRLNERMNPQNFYSWAKSVVIFAFPYARSLQPRGFSETSTSKRYQIAAYAGARDYHDQARIWLSEAEAILKSKSGNPDFPFYGFVDTAPVYERDLASEAGLGWRGKNCCTIDRTHGSAFHLAGFFLDIPLPYSTPVEEFCGGCRRCLDQCPTQAFTGPGQLDANKCISYWTIEAKTKLPTDLTEKFGGWIFGCDICQEVCPWNHKHIRPSLSEDNPFPEDGIAWLKLLRKGGGFQSRFKRSPLNRAGRKSLLRNIALAAANLQDYDLLNPLVEILVEEEDPAVRHEIERSIERLKKSPF